MPTEYIILLLVIVVGHDWFVLIRSEKASYLGGKCHLPTSQNVWCAGMDHPAPPFARVPIHLLSGLPDCALFVLILSFIYETVSTLKSHSLPILVYR